VVAVAMLAITTVIAGCGGQQNSSTESQISPLNKTTETSQAKQVKETGDRALYLTTVDELKGNLGKVIVWDARADKEYNAGHIKGAINAPWQMFAGVTAGNPGDKGWGTLLPADKIADQLGKLGIDTTKEIVVYADPNGWGEDGRIVWMLRMAGISNSKMLDGGWPAWQAADNETSTEAVKLSPTKATIASLDEALNTTTDAIKSNTGKIKVVDARSEKEFTGATDFGEARGGHLPGAINIPFKEVFNNDGTVKSESDLKALFEKAGLKQDDEIVSYCTKGIRSAYLTMLLQMTGFKNAKNYDASFYEWAGDKALTVEE
jgi:thiosulfate/3-mercaptopyruvate sulfurtransferase